MIGLCYEIHDTGKREWTSLQKYTFCRDSEKISPDFTIGQYPRTCEISKMIFFVKFVDDFVGGLIGKIYFCGD